MFELGQNKNSKSYNSLKDVLVESFAQLEKLYNQIIDNNDCLSIKDLAVNGKDLIEAGIPAGPLLGQKLEEMFELVLQNPAKNTREDLMKLVL